MKYRQLYFRISRILLDYLIMVVGFNLSFYIIYHSDTLTFLSVLAHPYFKFSLIFAFFGILTIENTGLYQVKRNFDNIDVFFLVLKAMIFTTILVIITSFIVQDNLLINASHRFPGSVIGLSFVINLVSLTVSHRISRMIIQYFRKRGIGLIKVLIVGIGEVEKECWKVVNSKENLGYKAVGFLVENKSDIPKSSKLKRR